MRFILPTHCPPKEPIQIGDWTISPNGRLKIQHRYGYSFRDSVAVESSSEDWLVINEWAAFHAFIFDDSNFLDWYEGADYSLDTLVPEASNSQAVDYQDISGRVYFPSSYPAPLRYQDLFEKFIERKDDRFPVLNYFNSFLTRTCVSAVRGIRDNTYWRILALFSVVEFLVGPIPTHRDKVTCASTKSDINWDHNDMPQREWIEAYLMRVISDQPTVKEYLEVIVEVRNRIRHKTVHASSVPSARLVHGEEGELAIYDWPKTREEWKSDSTALLSLELRIRKIARYLLLNRMFDLALFPPLTPLFSVRIKTP